MTANTERLPAFVVSAPGLERLAAEELAELGIGGRVEPGGVSWDSTPGQLYAANLNLRTATRVLVRVAEFRARSFIELERHARRIAWDRFVGPERPVELRVTCRKSRLYHEGAVAQRVLEAIERRVGQVAAAAPGESEDAEGTGGQMFIVRFVRDVCTISVDSSGASLHMRGYRQALARAPLRETFAAAMLRGSGWHGQAPLVDPMCGSGTIAIEAALIARGVAPGLAFGGEPRPFAFRQWAEFDAAEFDRVVAEARQRITGPAGVPIHASDRDAGAIEAARSNAERAGVLDDLELAVAPVSAVEPPAGTGWVVVNPPYGVRVGESGALRNLYAGLGNTLRQRMPGWTLAMLSADPALEAQVGLAFEERFRSNNGGIPVRLIVGEIPHKSDPEPSEPR